MSMKVVLRTALCALACTLAACGGSSSDNSTSSSDSSSSSSTSSVDSTGAAVIALSSAQYTVSAATIAVLSINRLGPSTGVASVSYATYNGTATAGTDYTATSGTVSWSDGETTAKEIYVPVTSLAAGRQFGVALTSVVGQATFGSPSSATVAVVAHSTAQDGSTSSSGSGTSTDAGGSGTNRLSAQAATLLNYVTGLEGESKHILVGQHSSYWDPNPMDNITALVNQTGTKPAILGTTLGISGTQEDGVALSNQWLAAGGIPDVLLVPIDPASGRYDIRMPFGAVFSDVYTPGTALNAAWNTYIDGIAAKMKQINGAFLFRPFAEMNGNWFWYGGQPTAQMIALWRYTYNRIVNVDGVKNAVWIYNINAGVGNYAQYYPGAAYVDIVSCDSYPPNPSDMSWYNALVTLDKPIILAETGASPYQSSIAPYSFDNNSILATVKAHFPKIVAIVVWCQNLSLSEQQGDEAFMTDSAVITLTDLTAVL
jgi:hypothetical protein